MAAKSFFLPRESLFGAGCLHEMGDELKKMGLTKALLVTDNFLASSPVGKMLTDELERQDIAYYTYTGVQPNPTLNNVQGGIAAYQENGCNFLIALGGGSANDCTKAIGILLANGGDLHAYQGYDKSSKPSPPIIAINTTAGTASEISRAYLITDEEKQVKMIMKDRNCMAAIAVNDPEMMTDLPKSLTASTGMDALTHAVESYVSTKAYSLTRRLAREAADCIIANLPKAVEEPGNIEAREQMTYGQYMAGMSFGNGGLGLVHSMAHPLGAVFRLGHGICNAILLPYVCRFNMQAAKDRYVELTRFLYPEAGNMSDDEAADYFIGQLFRLSEKIGTRIPLSTLGVTEADLPNLAEKALEDGNRWSNPIQPTLKQVIDLYREAL
ncbi:MAG: iron-containing alcohol dehydrogenase [Faecousia sp.]